MGTCRRGCAGLLSLLAIIANPTAPRADEASADLPTVAAVGLCADHHVLALAHPDQIVSLSHQAAGPLSPNRALAARYPTNRGSAEELMMLSPDVVVLRAWGLAPTVAMLERFGIPVVRVGAGFRLEDAITSIQDVGAAIGRPDAAAALVAEFRSRLDAARSPIEGAPVAAYFRPDGGSAGAGTFVDDILTAAGLANLKAELGESGWGRLDLEALLLNPPDLMVVSYFDTASPSVRGALARHPVFRRLSRDIPMIGVPGEFWPCTGPHLIDAIDHLSAEIANLGLAGQTP